MAGDSIFQIAFATTWALSTQLELSHHKAKSCSVTGTRPPLPIQRHELPRIVINFVPFHGPGAPMYFSPSCSLPMAHRIRLLTVVMLWSNSGCWVWAWLECWSCSYLSPSIIPIKVNRGCKGVDADWANTYVWFVLCQILVSGTLVYIRGNTTNVHGATAG